MYLQKINRLRNGIANLAPEIYDQTTEYIKQSYMVLLGQTKMGLATPLVSALTRAAWLQETAHLGKSLAIDLAAWSSHLLSEQKVFGLTPGSQQSINSSSNNVI